MVYEAPLTASVTILVGSSTYYNSATTGTLGSNEFRLTKGMVTLAASEKPSDARLYIEDNNNKFFSTFIAGSTVYMAIGKVGTTFTSIFGGRIERADVRQELKGVTELTLNVADWSQDLMNKVVIHYERHQVRDTQGLLVATDEVSVRVTDIIIDLMNSSSITTFQNGVPPKISAALSTAGGYITPSSISIPDVNYIYKPLSDCLKELFDVIRYVWFVDNNANLVGRTDESATDSGVTLDGSTVIDARIEDDATDTKNRIFVIGADQIKVGVSSSTVTAGNLDTSGLYLAQKFQPNADDLRYVQMYIDKVGDPANLAVGIYQDDGNKPTGSIIKFSEINKQSITTTPSWRQVEINEKITTSTAYWIVLFRSSDPTAYYRWYTDSLSGATTATATDGVTWSTIGATSTFAHQVWFANPLVYLAEDIPSTSTYGIRELAWRQAEIENFEQAVNLGKGLLGTSGKKKRMLTLNAVTPDTILTPGKLVTVSNSNIVTTSYLMTDITYELEGYSSYFVEVKGMKYI